VVRKVTDTDSDLTASDPIDYLIVGQGLAGSILAWLLEQHRQHVLMVDNASDGSASQIAAGIVNPVAGQRLVKHPRAERCLERARSLYAAIGNFFDCDFYFERPQIRLFTTEKERDLWAKRKSDPAYAPYLGDGFAANQDWFVPANRYGGFHQNACGYLDTRALLEAIRTHFRSKNQIIDCTFSWSEIWQTQTNIVWQGRKVRHLISCEGFRAGGNAYFSWLPFQFSKGEIVTCECTEPLPDTIVNCGKWLLPLPHRVFRCGATYQFTPLDSRPSAPARETLCSTVRRMLPPHATFRVVAQQAGIRPGSLDKQPFAGMHPAYPRIGIFNGFGSRGVLTIPYYAERFVAHLLYNAELPPEIDLRRYPVTCETG
jgi:glycine oxidase